MPLRQRPHSRDHLQSHAALSEGWQLERQQGEYQVRGLSHLLTPDTGLTGTIEGSTDRKERPQNATSVVSVTGVMLWYGPTS